MKKKEPKQQEIKQKTLIRKPSKASLTLAAKLIQQGNLVAFPTETVYGLGANACDPRAASKIFVAKGRPSDNPLIVHISNEKQLNQVAQKIPAIAKKLMAKFWPGPLTLVFLKKAIVPDVVTAGSSTVAVRMPKHPVARKLIELSGCPIAAPSANTAGKPSPTTAAHVYEDLNGKIPLILDGGKTEHGLESTVLDLTEGVATLLRSGAITKEAIEKVLGKKIRIAKHTAKKVKSPGMKYKHYAPAVEMILVQRNTTQLLIDATKKLLKKYANQGKNVGILCRTEHTQFYRQASQIIPCGSDQSEQKLALTAQKLYAALRQFQPQQVDIIIAEGFPYKGLGQAIMDRLTRAATHVDKK